MLGWEFPPFISGGLGTACHGLTRGMNEIGTEVLFVLPKPVESSYTTHVTLLTPNSQRAAVKSEVFKIDEFENVTFRTVDAGSGISSYQSPAPDETAETTETVTKTYTKTKAGEQVEVAPRQEAPAASPPPQTGGSAGAQYQGDMFQEVEQYAQLATQIALQEHFDLVHAHDWMTYRAGIAVAALTGKPLVVHIHSTEFDRSGEHVNQRIYDIERQGMHMATKVIAVSYLTKNIVVNRYGVPADRVEVVYNAVEFNGNTPTPVPQAIDRDEKLVLFLGRITMQKGPEYFLGAAKKVLQVIENVRFVMAGSGDMVRRTIEMAAEMGIGHKVLFTGFLRGGDVDRVFRMADLYVMPSVSEPFGIAPLEAMSNDVPVIISKQSGVSEVLTHALKVDFWDIDEMANKIIAVLRHPSLQSTLRQHGRFEVTKLSWSDSARNVTAVYEKVLQNQH
jgi:glycosyltransferase involved in cell wall biosynthesis